jgi:hypothetical protein
MIIKCFRCDKGINAPDASNADYIIAKDTIVKEPREVFIAQKHTQATLAKLAENPDLELADGEYDAIEIPSVEASKSIGEDLVKVIVEVREKDIQKTGIVCPNCYRETDFVIWGVHKARVEKLEKK